jgi:2-C-methyl-D-erythritol 2,4-cyclodiphosphate synthase
VTRVGQGFDIHRLVPDRPLVLGGVELPWDVGLQGHSDADVVCHALTDAVLGAAGLGDIGELFPDGDPQWKGARSLDLLAAAVERVREQGLRVTSADVTVVLEVPRLQPYRAEIRSRLAGALGVDATCVGVKAKTSEGLGPTGSGEAIAALAVAVLEPG